DPTNRALIKRLEDVGVVTAEPETDAGPQPLAGKTFVLTGTLTTLTRDAAREAIERRGGRVIGSVSKETDYVVVGESPGGEPVTTVEVYDRGTDRWEARASLPAPAHHLAAAVVDGRLFVAGGYAGRVGWTPLATVYEYDAARNSWATRAPLRTPRGALALVALDGRLHAVGGSGASAPGAHEIYAPAP